MSLRGYAGAALMLALFTAAFIGGTVKWLVRLP